MIEEFCEIFEYLKQRIECNPFYEVKRVKKNRDAILRFFKNSNINSIEEIWDFLLFQLVLSDNKYSNTHSLTLFKCISINAIKRWKERTSEQMFVLSKLQRERGLRNPLAKQNSSFSEEYLDFLRNKFFNTPRGFILCGEYEGALYNDEKCKNCNYKIACKNGRVD